MLEGVEFGGEFGGIEPGGEVGIALGGSGNGAMGAADDVRGHAAAAAVGEDSDDLPSFGVVERGRATATLLVMGLVLCFTGH